MTARPWLPPGRPPWARRPRLTDAGRWLFVVAALFVLDPARAVRTVTTVLAEFHQDAD